VDIAGLVRGASKGEGLGNQFLSHIRQTHALAHVVRCFDDDDITHVELTVDPIRDIEIIETELIFADHETVEKNLTRFKKFLKSGGTKDLNVILAMLEGLAAHLQALKPARNFDLSSFLDNEAAFEAHRDLHLITAKKILSVCNVEESLASGKEDNEYTKRVKAHAAKEGSSVVIISGKIEEELGSLPPDERAEMLAAMGVDECGLDRLAMSAYSLLGYITYFTAGEKEIRAWTVKGGSLAPQAAGVIHSDFEKGFICAEVFRIEDLLKAGQRGKLKEMGLLRMEGKGYTVVDGDVMEFRFNRTTK
jgi:GTP-binding protein YchF